jgi:hypothetical protein
VNFSGHHQTISNMDVTPQFSRKLPAICGLLASVGLVVGMPVLYDNQPEFSGLNFAIVVVWILSLFLVYGCLAVLAKYSRIMKIICECWLLFIICLL